MKKGGATKRRRQSFSKRKLAKKPVRNSARRKQTRQSCKKSNRVRYGGVLYEGGETEAMNLIFQLIKNLPKKEGKNENVEFIGRGNSGITFELDVDVSNRPIWASKQQFFGLNDAGTDFDKPINKVLVKLIPPNDAKGDTFVKEVLNTQECYVETAKNGHPFTPSLITSKILDKDKTDDFWESDTLNTNIFNNEDNYLKTPINVIVLEYFDNYQTVDSYLRHLANELKDTTEEEKPKKIEEIINKLKEVFGRIAAYLIILADFTKKIHHDAHLGNIMIDKNDEKKIKIIDLDNMLDLKKLPSVKYFDLSEFLKTPTNYYNMTDKLTKEDGQYKNDYFTSENSDIIFGVILANFLSYLIQLRSESGHGILGIFRDENLAIDIISKTVADKESFINQSVIPIIEEYLAFQPSENLIKALETPKFQVRQTFNDSGFGNYDIITRMNRIFKTYTIKSYRRNKSDIVIDNVAEADVQAALRGNMQPSAGSTGNLE